MELEMTTDTNLSELVINKLTKQQYAEAEKDANALYMITDEEFIQTINDVSPTDGNIAIKTINGESLLGSGDITIDISGKQDTSNLVTSLSSTSSDTQYPSAKCVYDLIGDVETLINNL